MPNHYGGLTPGGPCPAPNAAMAGAALMSIYNGQQFSLVQRAFAGIAEGDTNCIIPVDSTLAHLIMPLGGSHAGTSKLYPPKKLRWLQNSAKVLVEKFDGLVVTGGDGTIAIFDALEPYIVTECKRLDKNFGIQFIMKSVDDDATLPPGARMLGASTLAEQFGIRIANLRTDCKSIADRWQLAIAMGRLRGHAALAGSIHGFPHIFVIGEQLPNGTPLSHIGDLLCGTMIKRAAFGKPYGVAVIAEGIVNQLDRSSHKLLETLPTDENGAPSPSSFPFEAMLDEILNEQFAKLDFKLKFQVSPNSYDLRGSAPNAFDRRMGIELGGYAIQQLLAYPCERRVIYKLGSKIESVPFSNFVPSKGDQGRVADRAVEIDGNEYRIARQFSRHLRTSDFENDELLSNMAAQTSLTPGEFIEHFRDAASWGDN